VYRVLGVTFPPTVPGYTLEHELGVGMAGVVWKARRDADALPVAIKFLTPESPQRDLYAKFFQREMAAMRLLEHPNLVRSLDEGSVGSIPYLVMEHCRFGDLQAIVPSRGGRMPPRVAAQVMLQLLDALQAIHARGWVHRDVKPANVFVTTEAGEVRVKLSDLGLAHCFEKAGQTSLSRTLLDALAGSL
jgi:serine/threonine protein kinase